MVKDNGYVKAEVGESPILYFTVESQPPLLGSVEHILKTEDGEDVTKRFHVQESSIIFNDLRMEDSGKYTISCSNKVRTGECTLELEIMGKLNMIFKMVIFLLCKVDTTTMMQYSSRLYLSTYQYQFLLHHHMMQHDIAL